MDRNLLDFVLSLGDESLVLGQRLSYLCSRGPSLEEDIAVTNTALDYIGRARFFYQYANTIQPQSQGEDFYAYYRDYDEFTNRAIYETENLDYAHTMLRQYLIDVFELQFFEELGNSNFSDLNAICKKTIKEVRYHKRRSDKWMDILCNSTEEAQKRLQTAIDQCFCLSHQLFIPSEGEKNLLDSIVDRRTLKDNWLNEVSRRLGTVCRIPKFELENGSEVLEITHNEGFATFIEELQFLIKKHPNCIW